GLFKPHWVNAFAALGSEGGCFAQDAGRVSGSSALQISKRRRTGEKEQVRSLREDNSGRRMAPQGTAQDHHDIEEYGRWRRIHDLRSLVSVLQNRRVRRPAGDAVSCPGESQGRR